MTDPIPTMTMASVQSYPITIPMQVITSPPHVQQQQQQQQHSQQQQQLQQPGIQMICHSTDLPAATIQPQQQQEQTQGQIAQLQNSAHLTYATQVCSCIAKLPISAITTLHSTYMVTILAVTTLH